MRNSLFTLLLCTAMTMMAVPAKRGVIRVFQPDGTSLSLTLHGDESFSWQQTTDGYEVMQNAQQQWVYVAYDEWNNRMPSNRVARNVEDRLADDQQFVQLQRERKSITHAAERQRSRTRRITSAVPTLQNRTLTRAALDPNSKKKGLCLLVQFSDVKFKTTHTQELFARMMNEPGFTYGEQKGSVRDYYFDNSQQTYEPNFTVLGPITLSKNMAYYGTNHTQNKDDNFGYLLKELLVASTFESIDLSQFDQDNDGFVDQAYIIYAGYAESNGASSTTIWPHSWDVNKWNLTINRVQNKSFGSYACSSELNGAGTGSTLCGIGVVCHEFGHVLGLADMYDTSSSNNPNFGLDTWSLMDYGSYCNDGYTPCNLNAWERYQLGWLNIRELNTPQQVSLKALDQENDGIILTSAKSNEYYILENRQSTGWDAHLPASGMLVYHVDFNQNIWNQNTVNNNSKHPYFQLKAADNHLSSTTSSLEGDPFPGSTNNRSFTDSSTPNSSLWDGSALKKPLTNIAQSADGSISFSFMEGVVTTPIALAASNVSTTGFTANWQTAEGVTDYVLTVYTKKVQTGVATSETEPFKTSGTTLTGWSKTGGSTYTSSGNYGAAAPSIKMDGTGQLIQTRIYPTPITRFQCWLKGQGTTNSSSSLTIEGYNGTSWKRIKTLTAGSGFTNSTASTFVLEPNELTDGYVQLRLTYTKGTGNLAIDDIKVTYGGTSTTRIPVEPYNNRKVGTQGSYNATNLTPDTYYYSLVAYNGGSASEASNEIEVNLMGSGVDDVSTTYSIFVNEGTVCIDGELHDKTVSVYNLSGHRLCTYRMKGSHLRIPLPQSGMYIVRIDGKSYKLKY